eukprot:scaffold6683_cov58-Phaeocystis_antarctica.AAC.6
MGPPFGVLTFVCFLSISSLRPCNSRWLRFDPAPQCAWISVTCRTSVVCTFRSSLTIFATLASGAHSKSEQLGRRPDHPAGRGADQAYAAGQGVAAGAGGASGSATVRWMREDGKEKQLVESVTSAAIQRRAAQDACAVCQRPRRLQRGDRSADRAYIKRVYQKTNPTIFVK